MIPAPVASFLAKPLVKYGLIALAVVAVLVLVVRYIDGVRSDGKSAGRNEVITKTQENTIVEIERARTETEAERDKIDKTDRDRLIEQLP